MILDYLPSAVRHVVLNAGGIVADKGSQSVCYCCSCVSNKLINNLTFKAMGTPHSLIFTKIKKTSFCSFHCDVSNIFVLLVVNEPNLVHWICYNTTK